MTTTMMKRIFTSRKRDVKMIENQMVSRNNSLKNKYSIVVGKNNKESKNNKSRVSVSYHSILILF